MRQLAIVGEDGQVRVEDLDLGHETLLPTGSAAVQAEEVSTICNWPTWSPDGQRVAFFRHTVVGSEVREQAVCVADVDGTTVVTCLSSESASPIYMAWSPDGRRLAVLVQEGRGLYLRLADSRGGGQSITVAQGAPLYYTWLPDSTGLVLHVGSGEGLAATSRLVWVTLEGGQAVRTSVARLPAAGFRAPVWANGRRAATVALEQGGASELALLTAPDAAPQVLTAAGHAPSFCWSPNEAMLAFASRGDQDTLYTGISVYAAADGSVRSVVESGVLAFFWCGNDRLLYVTGDLAQRTVAVRLVDVATAATTDLGWVRPSRDLLMLLGHFDQYSQSAALISPLGTEVALAASRAKEMENGSVPTVRQILVRALDGSVPERAIGRGRLAFWRPDPKT